MASMKKIVENFEALKIDVVHYDGLKSKEFYALAKKVAKIESAYLEVLGVAPTPVEINKILSRNINVSNLKDRLEKKL